MRNTVMNTTHKAEKAVKSRVCWINTELKFKKCV